MSMHSHILNIRVYRIYLYISSDINKRVHIKKQQKYKYPFTLAIPANMWPKQSESKNHIKQKKKKSHVYSRTPTKHPPQSA